MKKNLLSFFVALTFSHLLFAQNPDSSTTLNDVIITENRLQMPFSETSRSIEIIQRRQIEAMPVRTLPELLNYVVGVDVRQRGVMGVQPDITIRGGTFDQVLILINGTKMIDPQTGRHGNNIPIDVSQIERIEVLKGAGARIYGQNAFSGAINIVTKTTDEKALWGSVQVGDWGLLSGSVGGSLPIKNIKQTFSLSSSKSDGYRPNSEFNILNAFYQGQVTAFGRTLNAMGGYTERRFGASGFYNTVPISNEKEWIRTKFVSIDAPLSIGAVKITPRASWRSNVDEYFFNYLDYNTRNFTRTIVGTAEVNSSYKNKLGTTGFSLEYSRQIYRNARLGNHNRDIASAFLEHRFHLLDKLDITPGVLFAHYSDFGNQFFPGVDVGFRFTEKFKVYGNWGRTFRVPTYTDLYFFSGSINPNPNLQPETSNSFEIGGKFSSERISAQFAFFERDAMNLIDRTRNEATPNVKWNTNNQNGLLLRGVETGVQVRLDKAGRYHFDLSYFRVIENEFRQVEKFSRYALDFLTDQFNVGLEGKFGKGFSASLRTRVCKRYNQPQEYIVTDGRIGWQRKAWTVFSQANNIFDTDYTEQNNIPMPRRWFTMGMNFRFNVE
jgi:vitamin B12 transporter